MKLELHRRIFNETSTIGEILIDGVHECFTCEDLVRDPFVKIKGQTAIPAGTYQIIVNMSTRFECMMPLLLDVPEFDGVRIHTGNTDKDTEGCILVGVGINDQGTGIVSSRIAYDALFPKIDGALKEGQTVEIEIINEPVSEER